MPQKMRAALLTTVAAPGSAARAGRGAAHCPRVLAQHPRPARSRWARARRTTRRRQCSHAGGSVNAPPEALHPARWLRPSAPHLSHPDPSSPRRPGCPLCLEEMDVTDRNFRPCKCGYQICLFCYRHIKEDLNGLCPACRTPYDEANVSWVAPDPEECAAPQPTGHHPADRPLLHRRGAPLCHAHPNAQHTLPPPCPNPPCCAQGREARPREEGEGGEGEEGAAAEGGEGEA